MRITHYLFALLGSAILTGCGSVTESPSLSDSPVDGELSFEMRSVTEAFSETALANMTYTLVDTSVRSALTKASLGFRVPLVVGVHAFPPSMRSFGFTTVSADVSRVVRGDVTGDGAQDAVVPLFIESGGSSILELAVVTASGSDLRHVASIPIGTAVLNSLQITSGKIRVNFVHQVPGDPGPRNTELLFDLATEVATSTPSEL